MGKKVKSVEEMIKMMPFDKSFKEKTLKDIKTRSLSRLLFSLRCKHKISQKEVAKKAGCSQSKISKIEYSEDANLNIGDILIYAEAMHLQLSIGFSESNMKLVDKVKYHAFEIKRTLDQLADLAGKDEQILRGVEQFCAESVSNIIRLISTSYDKLDIPKDKRRLEIKGQRINLLPPMDMQKETLKTATTTSKELVR